MTYPERPLLHLLTRTSLVGQIIVGLIAGLLLASFFPAAALRSASSARSSFPR